MLEERSLDILEAAIREFIESGEPVSSSLLYKKYNFGIRPAMIRAELSGLSEDGYLEQPYHSAGRVPSNLGYEFFAERVLAAERTAIKAEELASMLRRRAWEDLLDYVSGQLGIASVAGEAGGEIHKDGLESLMESIPWGSRDAMMDVIRDFEALEQRVRKSRRVFDSIDAPRVFIGKKSPVTRSDELAVMAATYELDGVKICLLTVGPKRMNYEKTASLLRGLKRFLDPPTID